jgi:Domain of unknown function (DUF932)
MSCVEAVMRGRQNHLISQASTPDFGPPDNDTGLAVDVSTGTHSNQSAVTALDRAERNHQEEITLIGATNSNSIGGANRLRLSFDVAASRIIEDARGLGSERFPLSQLRVEGNRVITGEREFRFDAESFRRLCGHFRAPTDYLERLSPKLRDDLFAFHLRSMGQGPGRLNDASSRIIYRDGVFIDFGRADLHTLGARDVLHAVRDGFGADAATFEVEGLEIHEEAFRLDLVSPSVAAEVRPGDVLQAGVRVEHAYTGERATTIMAFVVRLVCSNGMVHRECVGSRRTARTRRLDASREDAGILQVEQVRHLTEEIRKELEPKLDAIGRLAQERADASQLERFLRQARMHSRGLVDQLRQSWAAEGDEQTAFGLFNAMTRLATHGTAVSARQRGMLARLAGIYANRSDHLCPHCFSILNSPSRN